MNEADRSRLGVLMAATFYLLPPAPVLQDALRRALDPWLPGLGADWPDAAALVAATVADRPDVYAVFRNELPDGADPEQALRDQFGAEPGDRVIEVRPGPTVGEARVRAWSISAGLPYTRRALNLTQ